MKCSYCGKFRIEDELIPVVAAREWFSEIESNQVICHRCIERIAKAKEVAKVKYEVQHKI